FQPGHDANTYIYNPVSRTWQFIDRTNYGQPRGDGCSVRLQDGRFMIVGGYQEDNENPPTASAEIIDLTSSNPAWQNVASMSEPRAFHDAVLLPDGNVLVIGGEKSLVPELYNPNDNTWTNMAEHEITRGYHSTALLLPDGRVICSGGVGNNGPGLFEESAQFEIWNPYYLYSTARPVINSMVSSANYGQQVSMSYSSSVPVSHVVIHRTGEQTHSFSYNQISERIALDSNGGGNLTFSIPSNSNVLPPCYYMVFLMSNDGVPSVAKWLQIGENVAQTLLGDVNLDGTVNLLDVQPFVALISTGQFQLEADVNQDSMVNLLDVAPFVTLLNAG
ncbi:MAG: galactose oxidase-like domain-containing protein, partial [Planctomycetota bacterium]